MKKYMVICAGLCLAMLFTGCKNKESAYRQAYLKAKAAEAAETGVPEQQAATPVETTPVVETPVVTPVETTTTTYTEATQTNVDNVAVRQERVSVVNGAGLRDFSVVVGSFSVITNAEGLQQRLKNAGYAAQIVKNEDRNMYRVVASTFSTKAEAVQSRDQLRATYPDAWLLFYTR